jgi:ribosomal protein S27AE
MKSFVAFLSDMGERPSGMTLERIDNNNGYSPENCKWGSRKEQARNRRSNRLISFRGKTKTLAEWGDILQIDPETISARIGKGWTIEKSLETPLRTFDKEATALRRKLYNRERGRRDLWKFRESRRRWQYTHKEQRNQSSRRWRRANKEKVTAHNAVAWALKKGRIVRPLVCARCSKPGRLMAHHDDYKKKLDVTWLCAPCHNRLHFLKAA